MKNVFDPTRPLWNARLYMVERASPNAQACADWYAALLSDTLTQVDSTSWQLAGPERLMRFSVGPVKTVPRVAFTFPDAAQWTAYRTHLASKNVATTSLEPDADLGAHAFELVDPDGRVLVFCVAPVVAPVPTTATLGIDVDPDTLPLPGRLQHFVCASTQTKEMLDFYRDVLGFVESDRVVDTEGDLSSAFVRSDVEHHSFAVFRAPQAGADHHAYEVPNWNAIRDWADHCGDLEIPLWWGPGRHGVGNNLFFMIEDPDGYKVEFSSELEHMTPEQAYREWPHGPRALNLWGSAWMRS
ncbi:MAG: VOC family protein [Casimicrobium sp.]